MSENRKFTKREDDFIRKNYRKMSYRDIADHLGRSKISINHRTQKLGLSKIPLRRWTEEEDQFIRDNYERGLEWLIQALGRNRNVVSARANELGFTFRRDAQMRVNKSYKCVRRQKNGERRVTWEHISVMEQSLGRELRKPECVHHINTVKTDNGIENLYLCRDRSHHKLVHSSLERLIPELLTRGVIRFNRDLGIYELCETSN